MLEIDPVTRTVSTFGQLGSSVSDGQCAGSVHCGEEKWIGGVLIPNSGKIIGIPYAAETVLEIDPAARTTTTFGVVSSSVKRKWVDGVLGRNGLVYAIPYDADVVLEIDPDTRALMLFGRVGADPCKWYGGVLGPNDKIYTIPYSSPYVLEIDTERRIARPFAMTYPHWGKWSGGVLAPNGKIYGIPALSKSVLEIDVEHEQTALYGMLPGGNDLQDKWAGGVLPPNGRIYGMPWRSSTVLEFDPTTKALSLMGQSIGSANFSWAGGARAKSGRIIAVPYNGAWVLEIGETVCNQAPATAPPATGPAPALSKKPVDAMPAPLEMKGVITSLPTQSSQQAALSSLTPASFSPPAGLELVSNKPMLTNEALSRTFVLALLGCPDASKASEDACFHLSHRTWHSAMVTIMGADVTLHDIRDQVTNSRLSHVPTNFCFLFNGHALDPNVEETIKATSVAIKTTPPDSPSGSQYIVLIDNVHCNIGPKASIISPFLSSTPGLGDFLMFASILCTIGFVIGAVTIHNRGSRTPPNGGKYYYNRVPAREEEALLDTESTEKGTPEQETSRRIPCLPHSRRMFKAAVASRVSKITTSPPIDSGTTSV